MTLLTLALVTTLGATAETSRAEALFAKGRAELKAGHVKEACDAFGESYSLEPALGALLNLASCFETAGRFASAFLRFNEAEAWAARQSDRPRQEFAAEHAKALKPKLSWLAITTARPVVGLVVRVGSEPEAPLGAQPVVVAVDPGKTHVSVSAPSMQDWAADFEMPAAGTTRSVVVPALTLIPGAVDPDAVPVATEELPPGRAAPAAAVSTTQQRAPAPSRNLGLGIAAIATGASLMVASGIGLYWSRTTYDNLDAQSRNLTNGKFDTNEVILEKLATIGVIDPLSWVGLGVGAACATVGVVLVAKKGGSLSASLSPAPGGGYFALSGEF